MKKPKNPLVKSFENLRKSPQVNKKGMVIFIVAFAAVGTALVLISLAATPTASIEPESKTVNSPAAIGSDSNASGGQYIKFGRNLPTPVFEVKSYGAKGDGVTDDTSAIQAALDAANNSGGSLHLPAGTYMISGVLYYGTRLTISGDGQDTTTIKNTRTRTDIATTAMLYPKQDATIKQNVTVQDMTFNQEGDYYDMQLGVNARDSILMSVAGTNNMTVQRINFRFARTCAIWSDNAVAYEHVSNLKVLHNHVFKANGDAFTFFGNLTDTIIDSNIVEDTSDEAIAVQQTAYDYPKRIQITNNTILDCVRRSHLGPGEDATPNGIDSFGADQVTISGNTVTNVFASGLRIGIGTSRNSTNITVTNNIVSRTGSGNNPSVTGVPSFGIFFVGTDNVTGSNNQLSNNPYGNIGAVFTNTNVHGFPPEFP